MNDTGSMLVRAGVVTKEQLSQARAVRQQRGGTLGSNLVQLGLVSDDALAEFFVRRLKVPRVPRSALEQVPKQVLGRFPYDMAAEFRVIPVEIDREGNLTLAMADPSDAHAVEEVSFFTGHYVMRAVATESDIDWALSQHFGIQKKRSLAPQTGARATEPAKAGAKTPAEHVAAATSAARRSTPPVSEPVLLTKVRSRKGSSQPPGEIVLLQKPKTKKPKTKTAPPPARTREMVSPSPVSGSKAPGSTPSVKASFSGTKPPISASSSGGKSPAAQKETPSNEAIAAAQTELEPMLTGLLSELATAQDRDAVTKVVLDCLETLFSRAVFFAIKSGRISGRETRGTVQQMALQALHVPVEAPSVFRDVLSTGIPHRGLVSLGPVNQMLAAALGAFTLDAVLVPVSVKQRVVSFIYADGSRRLVPSATLERIARETGAAYERILQTAKRA